MHTSNREIVADMTEDMRQQAGRENDLSSLRFGAQQFKKILIQTFDRYCESGLYTRKYHVPDHMVKGI